MNLLYSLIGFANDEKTRVQVHHTVRQYSGDYATTTIMVHYRWRVAGR